MSHWTLYRAWGRRRLLLLHDSNGLLCRAKVGASSKSGQKRRPTRPVAVLAHCVFKQGGKRQTLVLTTLTSICTCKFRAMVTFWERASNLKLTLKGLALLLGIQWCPVSWQNTVTEWLLFLIPLAPAGGGLGKYTQTGFGWGGILCERFAASANGRLKNSFATHMSDIRKYEGRAWEGGCFVRRKWLYFREAFTLARQEGSSAKLGDWALSTEWHTFWTRPNNTRLHYTRLVNAR